MRLSGVGVLGIGVALPKQVRRNSDWPANFADEYKRRRKEDIGTISAEGMARQASDDTIRITIEELAKWKDDPFRGSIERRVLEADRETSDLEIEAAREALSNAGISAADVGALLVWSLVPDLASPNNGGVLHRELGLPQLSPAIGVDTACGSFASQVQVGAALIRSGAAKYVLLIQSSTPSRVIDYLDPQSPTFGDAATAVVLGAAPADRGFQSVVTYFNGRYHKVVALAPSGKRGGRWYAAKDGPLHIRSLDYKGIGETMISVGRLARESTQRAIEEAGIMHSDVSFFACHQTLASFIPICQRSAELGHARTMNTFPTIGSVFACSIPINLYFGMKEGLLRKGDTVAFFTTGAGMNWNAGITRWEI